MARSAWKGPFADKKLLKKSKKSYLWSNVWTRRSVAIAALIGCRLKVYNGKVFKKLTVTRDIIGYKLGEFSTTRQKKNSSKKKKQKKHGSKS